METLSLVRPLLRRQDLEETKHFRCCCQKKVAKIVQCGETRPLNIMATRRTTEVDPIASVSPLNLLKTELFLCLRSTRSSSIAATGAGSSRREVSISPMIFRTIGNKLPAFQLAG